VTGISLFVGSGIVIEYQTPKRARENLHQELTVLLRVHDDAPASRWGDQPKLLFRAKRSIKWVLGMLEEDKYDLNQWLVRSRG
jgi:hypothetical protein